MFEEQERPGAVGVLHARAREAVAHVSQRLGLGELHQEQLVEAGILELNGRHSGGFHVGSHNHNSMALQEHRVVVAERVGERLRHLDGVDALARRKDRHAIGKQASFAFEGNEADIQEAEQNAVARMTVKHGAHVGAATIDGAVDDGLDRQRAGAGQPLGIEVYRADILGLGQCTGITRVDQEGLPTGQTGAQMARAGLHILLGEDLNGLDEAPG